MFAFQSGIGYHKGYCYAIGRGATVGKCANCGEPAEQARQLAALQALVLGLLGLGIDAGAVAIPGPLGGPGAALALYN